MITIFDVLHIFETVTAKFGCRHSSVLVFSSIIVLEKTTLNTQIFRCAVYCTPASLNFCRERRSYLPYKDCWKRIGGGAGHITVVWQFPLAVAYSIILLGNCTADIEMFHEHSDLVYTIDLRRFQYERGTGHQCFPSFFWFLFFSLLELSCTSGLALLFLKPQSICNI